MTTGTRPLLVELLVEELPPKALKKLGEAFAALLADGLKAQGLAAADAAVTAYASPRRLAVHVAAVAGQAADQALRKKLMPSAVAFGADGKLTVAALKRLEAIGADASQVQRVVEGKAEFACVDVTLHGGTLADGLQKALAETIARLPIPKLMQYQLADGWTSVQFVRPAHGLVALHGDAVVAVSVLGLQSGRNTRGHRFEAPQAVIELRDADSYAQQLLEQGAVIASFETRRAELVRQLQAAADKEGLQPIDDDALVDEVTALVERPNVLLCRFEPEFLAVPPECLILTMKANQKYFPLLDMSAGHPGKLTNRFLVVSNISPADPGRVIEGNERVVRPRLADAKFFYDQDRKKTLASRLPLLDRVVYHGKLGSQGERAERVRAIGHAIVQQLSAATMPYTVDARDEFEVLDSKVQEAARLAKTDLLTDMVGEFPELQGVMGGYYARHDGLRDGVAIAIEDHYKPRFAGDALPRNHTGTVLALADKLETLAGLFGIGQLPSGDKDPYALRRHALGVVRMLVEKNLALDLPELVDAAFKAGFPKATAMRARRWRSSSKNGCSATCATAVTAPTKSRPWLCHPQRPLGLAAQAPGCGACLRCAARGGGTGGCQQARRQHPEKERGGTACRCRPSAVAGAGRAHAVARVARRRSGRAGGIRTRRAQRLAAGPGGVEDAGRCLLRQRDGQRRRRGAAPQPPGLAGATARSDEPRCRPVAPGVMRPPGLSLRAFATPRGGSGLLGAARRRPRPPGLSLRAFATPRGGSGLLGAARRRPRPPGLSLRAFATPRGGSCSGPAEPVPRMALVAVHAALRGSHSACRPPSLSLRGVATG